MIKMENELQYKPLCDGLCLNVGDGIGLHPLGEAVNYYQDIFIAILRLPSHDTSHLMEVSRWWTV